LAALCVANHYPKNVKAYENPENGKYALRGALTVFFVQYDVRSFANPIEQSI
jgi:hypothetical protein